MSKIIIETKANGKMTWRHGPDNKNPPVYNITQADCNSAARGLNMLGMSCDELKDIIALHSGSHLFAGQVTCAAASQMLAVKKFNGAI
jgi:hypothetical protein